MKRYSIILISLLAFVLATEGQNLKNDIEYLASETCFGRGLTNEGIFYAERYIVNELEALGLKVYTQGVKYKINSPNKSPLCIINDDTLKVGYDFIPHPFCPPVNRTFSREEIDLLDHDALEKIKDSLSLGSVSQVRRYLMKKSKKKEQGSLLLFVEDHPILSRQSQQYNRPAYQIDKSFIPDTIHQVYVMNDVVLKRTRTNNVIAVINGSTMRDSIICISAHYDHMGGFGDVYYPGANDNASGVAVLLALARYYAETPPPMTLVFCFFTGEEQGLKGSWRYVKKPILPLKRIMMAVNLDMVGSGLNGYGVVGGNEQPNDISILEDVRETYGIGQLKLRPNSPNSDHFPFTAKGVKAMFFYASGGEQPYHHPDDVPETLDWQTMENTILLIKEYIQEKSKY